MKIIVCMKQVPAGTKVDIDPETGSMKRLSGATRTNPYDLFALEAALQLREKLGGQLSGEHGIGNGRIEFLEDFVGERMIRLYKAVKLAFDDKLILNPGKMNEFNK